ncbi:HTH domain-containing protein [Labilibaculum euxinus]|uniref:HTH domain-containing protein n=1 Tax=Labilibaculum euxinus TaxID=2686357 RepID=A0A7M4D3W2_9BACT|nr:HTH domain-containing protein [Labilibaculum euxinus]MUP37341.1 HTH domain-containing protein [Labilibaculum euxinus]MVB06546.1 HTH domain-containing protein [Labilibaculum euxinus]
MDIFRQIEILRRLNKLIEKESTGKPSTLSNQLGISRSQLYRMIELLKDYGVPIMYSRVLETFYYSKAFRLKIELKLEDLSRKELKDFNGGEVISRKFFPSNFWDKNQLILGLID